MLLSSHALTELEDRADRVIIVNRGVKIADGTLDELRHIINLSGGSDGEVPLAVDYAGEEDEVRYALTSEAGVNDGAAFPFVHLAIALAAASVTAEAE